jgi:diguanylate cyclase (GGDEF)-like protein/PAS domain S-box-containing protein
MISITALAGGGFSLLSIVLLAVCLRQREALRAYAEQPMQGEVGLPDIPGVAAALNPELQPPMQLPQPVMVATSDLFREIGDRVHEVVLLHGDVILYANPQFAALAGLQPDQIVGRHLSELVVPEQKQPVADNLRQRLAGEPVAERYEIDLLGDQGQMTRLEIATSPVKTAGRDALLVTGVEVIPSGEQPASGSAASPRSHARNAVEAMAGALLTTDAAGRIDYANPAACRLLGMEYAFLKGATLAAVVSLVDETDRKLLADPVDLALHGNGSAVVQRRALLLAHANGTERAIELSAAPIRAPDNAADEITGVVVLLHDVTESRGITQQMSYQATHDALTGLVNRPEFEQRLGASLQSAQRGTVKHVLCYVDLDHFKNVNDVAGHLAGDAMLREVAKLLRSAVRDSDTVARLGGDEFALLLVGCPLEKGQQISQDLARSIAEYRFVWKDRIFTVGASVGLVELARDSGTLEEALAAADSACYVAKKQGSGCVAVYSARDEVVARQSGEIHWLQTLQTAIRENLFRLYQQPIVSSYGHEQGGPCMEVLVRLADDTGREVPPQDFLRAAERYRLMGLVDRWVVQATLSAMGRGAIVMEPGRSLAINISAQTLADTQFLEFVVDCFDRTGVNPAQVCFELPEAAVVANPDHARRLVGVLHGLGSQFALDDFGSNLGSFSNLKNLPIDYLKIDGSFMRNLARDSVNQAMVTAMVKMARTLKFKLIAEQVEDVSAMDAARAMGIDYLQGFAVGRPRPLSLTLAA